MSALQNPPPEAARHQSLGRQIWVNKRLYLYIAPTIILLLTFAYYPAISALLHAFDDWTPVVDVSEETPTTAPSGGGQLTATRPEDLPPANTVIAIDRAKWVGMKNFRELYAQFFTAEPALAGRPWAVMQPCIWLAMALLVLTFAATEWQQKHKWKGLPVATGVLAAGAIILTGISFATGLGQASALKAQGLLRHLLVGHLVVLGLAAGQVLFWRLHRATGKGLWWQLLACSTVAGVIFAVGLLGYLSQRSDLRDACSNLVQVMAFGLTVGLLMPLFVAELLFQLRNDRWKYIYRVAFIIPMVVPGIVGLLMWQFIYDYNWGVLNKLILAFREPTAQWIMLALGYLLMAYLMAIRVLGVRRRGQKLGGVDAVIALVLLAVPPALWALWMWADPQPQNWLGDTRIALYAIMLMGFPWVGTISMLIFYAGLQAISQEVLESARLDGATGLRRFFTIDFPLILGQFKLLLILGIIGGIQGFGSVLILTYGGPGKSTEMPGLSMFKEAFNYGKLGYGTTIGVAMFLVILALTYVNMKYIRPSAEEDSR